MASHNHYKALEKCNTSQSVNNKDSVVIGAKPDTALFEDGVRNVVSQSDNGRKWCQITVYLLFASCMLLMVVWNIYLHIGLNHLQEEQKIIRSLVKNCLKHKDGEFNGKESKLKYGYPKSERAYGAKIKDQKHESGNPNPASENTKLHRMQKKNARDAERLDRDNEDQSSLNRQKRMVSSRTKRSESRGRRSKNGKNRGKDKKKKGTKNKKDKGSRKTPPGDNYKSSSYGKLKTSQTTMINMMESYHLDANSNTKFEGKKFTEWDIVSSGVNERNRDKSLFHYNNGEVTVKTNGVFWVYAQVTYLTVFDTVSNSIRRVPQTGNETILAKCTNSVEISTVSSNVSGESQSSPRFQQCYTSKMVVLHNGDKVYVTDDYAHGDPKTARQVDFKPEWTFWGLMKMNELPDNNN